MQLKNVVLPAPLGPMTLTICPSCSSKSSVFTAIRPPNRLVTPGRLEEGHPISPHLSVGPPAATLAGPTFSGTCISRLTIRDGRSPSGRNRIITIRAMP